MSKKNFKFSVIIPVYNVEDYLEETLESIINQTIGFEDNIQIVLINDGSPDNSDKICERYFDKYPENIIYQKQENAGVSAARNKGIELATGELTNFLDSDDLWSEDSFEIVYKNYLKHNDIGLFSCKLMFFEGRVGNHPLNYKFKEDRIINILEEYEYPQLSSSSIFIKTDVVKKHRYDATIKYGEDCRFINEIIFELEKMMLLKAPIYYYRKRLSANSAMQNLLDDPSWYLVTPEKTFKYLYDLSEKKFGRIIEYIQFLFCYDLKWRIAYTKRNSVDDTIRNKYIGKLNALIERTDENTILSNRFFDLYKKMFLLETKYGKSSSRDLIFEDEYVIFRDLKYQKKSLNILIFDNVFFRDGYIHIYGKLDMKFVKKEDFNIKNDGKKVEFEYYTLTNDFNVETFNHKYLKDFIGISIKLKLSTMGNLTFYNKKQYIVPRYGKNGLFTNCLYRSYHHISKNYTIVRKGHNLVRERRNFFKTFYYELRNDFNLIKRKKFKICFARLYTKAYKLFKRKELWFISDRINKADDNGEHFFKYMVENYKDKNVYFVLDSGSSDFDRMSKIGKVIEPKSLRYKLLFHSADYIVSAHAEDYIINPMGKSGKYIRDLYEFKYVFLQHGIIKDDLSQWLNINTKKMDMFVTSTKDEYKSVLACNYYYGPEVVKLTGLPRYDTLLSRQKEIEPKNTIMLSFTWRSNLATSIDKNTGERAYNKEFKNTEYYKFLNNLMNDKKLLKVLKEKKYKIRFIPHPNVLAQLRDFKINDCVEVESGAIDYQKEFCQNKILVTDYSSVFFDFAYLNKPVIYYQDNPEEFFAQQVYDKGYFDYETMGFGPVLSKYDDVINELIKMIENDCKLEKKYLSRINDCFAFHDDKNCERVFKEIEKL